MRNTGSRGSVLVYCLAVLGLLMAGLWFGVGANKAEARKVIASNLGATTFPGTGTGAIPDNAPTNPRVVSFAVTGLSGTATDISVNMTANHSWIGDLTATLRSPDGTMHSIFTRPGYAGSGFGTNSDLAGLYNFTDAMSAANLWTTAAANPITPPGNYRSSAASTGAITSITPAFAAIPSLNGTWTLSVSDSASGDTGAVTAANLSITTAAAPTGPANVDFDGDGTSDFAQVRDATPPLTGGPSRMLQAKSVREKLQIQAEMAQKGGESPENLGPGQGSNILWAINRSGGSPLLSLFGEPTTDFLTPADFDGDGNADIAVWRGGPPTQAAYYIFESGSSTVRTEFFGQTGDDPTLAGDYDGDGAADPAVFRCPTVAGQCFFYYLGSNNNPGNNITYVPWGFGTQSTLFPAPGDYDGDGKYDFNLQGTHPDFAGKGLFTLLRSSDFGVEYIAWGNNTDLILPGDYDGDGTFDIAVGRNVGGQRQWLILPRSGAAPFGRNWGLSTDFLVPGDYDGDGATDVAIWRPDANPDNNVFYVLQSSNGMIQSFEWGLNGDYPIANWQVH